jgi:hypothetical protein
VCSQQHHSAQTKAGFARRADDISKPCDKGVLWVVIGLLQCGKKGLIDLERIKAHGPRPPLLEVSHLSVLTSTSPSHPHPALAHPPRHNFIAIGNPHNTCIFDIFQLITCLAPCSTLFWHLRLRSATSD